MKPSTPAWKADQPEEIDELLPAERADPFGTIGVEVRFISTLLATSVELETGADAGTGAGTDVGVETDAASGAAWDAPDVDVLLLVAGARLDADRGGVMVSESPG
jgi:hypothetical protein